ncbi:hypothetical protein K437DRAFT_230602 [Tilletiaria anomala UBC 951]|uniref:Translation initiation factor eIF2B subunit epsilon n=1 Tax=Tilletiaria anomala (strain ATCC 24038 / CBS 436.72 / UBC 951) TaxID=1037660 RepID=A0A066WQW8_TILAU|nr:uncharacterized protein K437DRAFT_230602 [Tilletiaria anomala UBC 951]KDN53379.1 hypothetical protein K437DRAFT_230602 [Tilletiaria anomala UBC 951]
MAPKQPSTKGGKSKKKGGGGVDIAQAEDDPLHAVILADSYNSRFQPLTLDKPRCLLPLVNAPLIDWTLEALALAGVQHTYVLARSHVELIRDHVASRMDSSMITVIATPEARSVGDAMRELDTKQLVKSDFLLVHADCVGNMDLAEVIRIHKERRKADKDAIMTMCTMSTAAGSRSRPYGDLALFCLQGETTQLLHYEALPAIPRKKGISLPSILFDEKEGHAEVELRNDLVDCGVDVCSVDVPPLFSENFDYQDLRRDFVTGILTSDLLESKIYVHVAPSSPHRITASSSSTRSVWAPRTGRGWGYAARVRDLRTYVAISKDVISRRLAPLGPGGNMPGGSRYSIKAGLRYTGDDVHLSRSCSIESGTLIGPACKIGERVTIRRSIIGPGCIIEDGAHISDSYIWANCKIGEDATIQESVLSEEVHLLEGVKVGRGTLIGQGCIIGSRVKLCPMSRVAKIRYSDAQRLEDEDDEDFSSAPLAAEMSSNQAQNPSFSSGSSDLGVGGQGFLWPLRGQEGAEDDEDIYDDDIVEDARNVAILQLAAGDEGVQLYDDASDLSSIDGDSDFGEDSDDEVSAISSATSAAANSRMAGKSTARASGARADSGMGARSEDMKTSLTLSGSAATAGEKAAAQQRLVDFHEEALASLNRAYDEKHQISNISIELKTLRMSSNVPPKEVCSTVVAFTLSKCDATKPKELVETMDHWGELIASVASDDEIEAISVMQAYCAAFNETHGRLFVPLLKKWYNDDVVSEEGILEWYKSPRSSKPPAPTEHLLSHPQLASSQAGAMGGAVMAVDLEVYAGLKKAAHEVIMLLLEDSEDEDDDEEDE